MKRTCKDIRREFIEFFEQRGHTYVPSSSLLPAEDPTLLFTNAGMNQFKDIFLGREKRAYNRAANSQKCIRAGGKHNDLEDVGHDTYHHTFFEMLGNWSFGDYFKKDAIDWAWELLTKVWQLPAERLHATYFQGDPKENLAPDDEARDLWLQYLPADRIHPGNKKDNFWEMGETGPCGPCSEIHFDFTPDFSGGPLVNGGDARVMEIWNLVFMQFNRDESGKLAPLPAKHVDTGMGLERVSRILQGVDSNYDIDVFGGIFAAAAKVAKVGPYTAKMDDMKDVAYRVVADHIRTLTFAIADGVIPSNEGRGYVIRRILRRAARYGRQYLGIEGSFLVQLVPTVVALMGESFPEIAHRQAYVQETIAMEEESFGKTLDRGIETWFWFAAYALKIRFLEEQQKKPESERCVYVKVVDDPTRYQKHVDFTRERHVLVCERSATYHVPPVADVLYHFAIEDISPEWISKHFETPPEIAGQGVFELYATYGFPPDLTALMARERGLTVDMAGFEEEMAKHRKRSAGSGDQFKMMAVAGLPATDDSAKYGRLPVQAKALGWVDGDEFVTSGELTPGAEAAIVLDKTGFYGEQGGQVGDTGTLRFNHDGLFEVNNTVLAGQCVLHFGVVRKGLLKPGTVVTAQVDAARIDTMRNHTATHLLNWALREVLGDHINQAGSVVSPDRLRFDFTHNQAVKPEELLKVETLVNQRILADEPVAANTMPLAQAKQIPGVRAVFGEKYPDPVRVISVASADGSTSAAVEFCGGTHLDHTGQVCLFKIIAEESVAKGVRRITAITGRAAVAFMQHQDAILHEASLALRTAVEELPARIVAMQKEIKDLRKRPSADLAAAQTQAVADLAIGAHKILVAQSPSGDPGDIRTLCDKKRQEGYAAIFYGGVQEDKVTLVAMVDDDLAKSGKLKAGDWVKSVAAIVDGSGGGKPTLAQAGGKKPEKLADALAQAAAFVQEKLKA